MSTDSTRENGSARPVSPAKLSHAVLRTTRLKQMVEWYRTVLNAEVLYQNDFLVFMTYDEEHHRIALAQVPGLVEKPARSTGLDHLAFFYSTFADWIGTYERLKAAGITPRVPIHHGLSMSLYYRDPDDKRSRVVDRQRREGAVPRLDAQSTWEKYPRNALRPRRASA
jgi:catechol-2,3-dioxygenase